MNARDAGARAVQPDTTPNGVDAPGGKSADSGPDGRRNGGPRAVAHPALAGFDERQIAAAREAALGRVKRSFRGYLSEEDIEDAAQDAWAALLEEQRETPIRDLSAFVAEVGWRSARGVARRPRTVSLDPEDSALLEREDLGSSPLDRLERRAAVARIVEAVEQLTDTEREAYRLWFVDDLEAVDAARRLGISRSAYFKRLTAAKARIEGAMTLDSHRFARAQRRLISDYVAGIAKGRAQVRAERLIAADPQAAAMAREIRRAHEAAAAALPVLFLTGPGAGDVVAPAAGFAERLRDLLSGWLGRGPDASELSGSPVLVAGGARGAGAAGAGLAAKAFGGLGASNIALGCLGGGAVATLACVVTGVLPLPGGGGARETPVNGAVERRAAGSEGVGRDPDVVGLVAPESTRPPIRPAAGDGSSAKDGPSADGTQRSDETTAPAPVVTTAPAVEQEFGVASAATPVDGAPPDTNDSDGASASTVRGEFGP